MFSYNMGGWGWWEPAFRLSGPSRGLIAPSNPTRAPIPPSGPDCTIGPRSGPDSTVGHKFTRRHPQQNRVRWVPGRVWCCWGYRLSLFFVGNIPSATLFQVGEVWRMWPNSVRTTLKLWLKPVFVEVYRGIKPFQGF